MNLHHARTFVTVAELGTVSKAAFRLRIAQPALSRHISELEDDLGLKLFDRVGGAATCPSFHQHEALSPRSENLPAGAP
jgi:DNA-binding transcriptional LysR family regulator